MTAAPSTSGASPSPKWFRVLARRGASHASGGPPRPVAVPIGICTEPMCRDQNRPQRSEVHGSEHTNFVCRHPAYSANENREMGPAPAIPLNRGIAVSRTASEVVSTSGGPAACLLATEFRVPAGRISSSRLRSRHSLQDARNQLASALDTEVAIERRHVLMNCRRAQA
jgi:hypothetical protein